MEYPIDYINKIHCADCLTFMKGIPDKCIDLVLTDPPYFLKWKQPIILDGRKTMYHHKEETEKWDSTNNIIDFYDNLFFNFSRLVKDTGSIILFCRFENISDIVRIAEKYQFQDKSIIYWHKTNPIPQIRKKLI